MKARVYHVQINLEDAAASLPFWEALLGYLEYRVVHEEPGVAGFSNGGVDLWLMAADAPHDAAGFHRKRPGLNHIAFRVDQRRDVDRFHREFLEPRGLPTLYGTPREFPEYAPGYYAVFFEDPQRIKLEVVHRPSSR